MSNDNNPAFPYANPQYPGLTKRELLAAMMLQGMQGNNENMWRPDAEQRERGITWADLAAVEAIELADALLTALEISA